MLWVKSDEVIKGGTSGSGVINEKGEIVGIVSWTSEQDLSGGAPRPILALPVWLCRKIYNR
jgi:S1-C subfamily serine protease